MAPKADYLLRQRKGEKPNCNIVYWYLLREDKTHDKGYSEDDIIDC